VLAKWGIKDPNDPEQMQALDDSRRNAVNGWTTTISKYMAQNNLIRNLDRTIGPIWAASGLRTAKNNEFVDWGLIQAVRRPRYNLVSASISFVRILRISANDIQLPTDDDLTHRGLKSLFKEYEPDSEFCRTWRADPIAGETVLKVGRTTKMTVGQVVELMSVVNVPGIEPSWAWRIRTLTEEPFCKGGDSGSWVIDANGSLCGLLFASLRGDDGLMVAAETLVKDIEKVTGWKVETPRKRG
jgi:hypothetical protein